MDPVPMALSLLVSPGHHDVAKLNQHRTTGFTPRTMASQNGHYDMLKFLLEAGAAANAVTETGFGGD